MKVVLLGQHDVGKTCMWPGCVALLCCVACESEASLFRSLSRSVALGSRQRFSCVARCWRSFTGLVDRYLHGKFKLNVTAV